MSEARKQTAAGYFLLPGDPNDSDISQRNAKKPHIPGVLPETGGRRQEQTASLNLYCQKTGQYRLWNAKEPHRIP